MKVKTILLLVIVAAGLLTMSSAASPAPAGAPGNAASPSPCDDEEAKSRRYKKFLDNYKGNVEQQKVAYEAGKEYISRYGSCPAKSDKKIVNYIRNWVARYEEAVREWERRHP
jgi:hypothetical protein